MNKILDYIEESLVCVCLVVMTALTFVNVVARYVFSASLSFSEEITTYLFVLLSLLGSAIAAKRGAHLGLTIISDRVGPKAGRVLGIISSSFLMRLSFQLPISFSLFNSFFVSRKSLIKRLFLS